MVLRDHSPPCNGGLTHAHVHTEEVLSTELQAKRLGAIVLAVGVFLVLGALASNTEQLWIEQPALDRPTIVRNDPGEEVIERPETDTSAGPQQSSPMPDWVAAGFLVAVVGIVLYLLAQHGSKFGLLKGRRHRLKAAPITEQRSEDERDEEVIRVTTDLIDDLSIEGDPRAAIQRAYAAVETGFGSRELARKPAETPMRYLQRVFGRHLDQAGPLHVLTSLFETARFSTQPVTEGMRSEAIEAVSEIREHYRSRRRGRVL